LSGRKKLANLFEEKKLAILCTRFFDAFHTGMKILRKKINVFVFQFDTKKSDFFRGEIVGKKTTVAIL